MVHVEKKKHESICALGINYEGTSRNRDWKVPVIDTGPYPNFIIFDEAILSWGINPWENIQ
jgi:hypothetical protein